MNGKKMSPDKRGFHRKKKKKEPSKEEILKQYWTPIKLCQYMVDRFIRPTDHLVLEPGCGDGAFLNCLPPTSVVDALEIDPTITHLIPQGFLKTVHVVDYLKWRVTDRGVYDLIIGNPPYGFDADGMALDIAFVQKSLQLLRPGGHIVFLMELKFLGCRSRFDTLWNGGCSLLSIHFLVTRPKFRIGVQGEKDTGTREYAIFEIGHKQNAKTEVGWADWNPRKENGHGRVD